MVRVNFFVTLDVENVMHRGSNIFIIISFKPCEQERGEKSVRDFFSWFIGEEKQKEKG